MVKLQRLVFYLAGNLITSNLWAVVRLGVNGNAAYLLFGITNILVIG